MIAGLVCPFARLVCPFAGLLYPFARLVCPFAGLLHRFADLDNPFERERPNQNLKSFVQNFTNSEQHD